MDVERVDARLVFDVEAGEARAEATMTFTGERLVFDLRQTIESAWLDDRSLPADAVPHVDLGGGPGHEMRVLDQTLDSGSHTLRLEYSLQTPDATDAVPVGFEKGAVFFDFWMSDLHPGRYLEMWLPANLCHDRFGMGLDVSVAGAIEDHVFLTNGSIHGSLIEFPDSFTSLSPMLVIAPRSRLRMVDDDRQVTAMHWDVEADVAELHAAIAGWLAGNRQRVGPYVHGDSFVAYIWPSSRGMEYDGATTASVAALEHEVFHSWFGRGIKPASANDGWIDEAWTTWCTSESSARPDRPGRFSVLPLGLDEDPVLLCPPSPWSRFTPVESYGRGSRLFAGFADLFGGAESLFEAMATFYRTHAGGFISTSDLEQHLSNALGRDLSPWFDRYVRGSG
jgi:hypothetical protein